MGQSTLHVALICTGNICRSPIAEVVLRRMVSDDQSLTRRVVVSNAGTTRGHRGNPMEERARRALDRAGFTEPGSVATYADRRYLDEQDIVIVTTRAELHEVRHRRTNAATDGVMLRNLIEPGLALDVADPFCGDERVGPGPRPAQSRSSAFDIGTS